MSAVNEAVTAYINQLSSRAHALRTAQNLSEFNKRKEVLNLTLAQIEAYRIMTSGVQLTDLNNTYRSAANSYAQELSKFNAHQLSWQQPSTRNQPTQTYRALTESEIQAAGEELMKPLAWYDPYLELLYPKSEPFYMRPAIWFGAAGLSLAVYYLMENK